HAPLRPARAIAAAEELRLTAAATSYSDFPKVRLKADTTSFRKTLERSGRQGIDADLDLQAVFLPAEHHAAQRADVAVIPSPCQRDMAHRRHDAVGGVEIDPSVNRTPDGDPRVRRVGPDQLWLSRRRIGE